MNRRGTIEWNLVTIGKLIISVAFILIIFALVMVFISIFKDENGIQAKKNFEMLITRINYLKENKMAGSKTSVMYSLGEEYSLVGFYPDKQTLNYYAGGGNTKTVLNMPSSCSKDSACLCLMNQGDFLDCRKIPFKVISTSIGSVIGRSTAGSEFDDATLSRVFRGKQHDCSVMIDTLEIRNKSDRLELECKNNIQTVVSTTTCAVGNSPCSGKKIDEYFNYDYEGKGTIQKTIAVCKKVNNVCTFSYAQYPCKTVYNFVNNTQLITNSPCQGLQPPFLITSAQGKFLCNYKSLDALTVQSGICVMSTEASGATVEVVG